MAKLPAESDRCQATPASAHRSYRPQYWNIKDHPRRGDRESLEDQVTKAVTSPITSGQPDEKAIIDRLSRVTGYAPLFAAGFPDGPHPLTDQNIAKRAR